MAYSAVAVTDAQMIDSVAPGAPSFLHLDQISNTQIEVEVQLPLQDANGEALSGLKLLVIATTPMTAGENPFSGRSMDEILAMAGVSSFEAQLTTSDAGSSKRMTLPVLNLGGFQAFAAAVAD